jgi:hypothetical protein
MFIVGSIVAALVLSFLWPILRFFFGLALLAFIINFFTSTASISDSGPKVLSFKELKNYPSQCAKADSQLAELKRIQQLKNFDSDPDNLDEDDRDYNSRLKSTIWWYAYKCNKS